MKHVIIHTDGACSGNPGPGGWAAILKYGRHERELSGGERQTTNNRMELTAAIKALEALTEPCRVTLYSDSSYLVNGMTKGWAESWQKNGWRKSDKKPALNPDLWERLLELCQIHKVEFVWIRGHDGDEYNERCDRLAVARRDEFAKA
ncbi:MAG: ribonuclease HI [Eubacteriales bacterium]|jgi:ribonuclease HI|nr:ribonuclease HI [Clostridiales bacterium]